MIESRVVQCKKKRVVSHQSNILAHHIFLFDQQSHSSITTIQTDQKSAK